MKYQKYLLIFLFTFLHADDLDLGSNFSAGDTVSASVFNSRFNEIEKISKLVEDSDLIGTWTCKSVRFRSRTGYTQVNGGFAYELDGTITFSESDNNSSLSSPKAWTTSVARLLYDSNDTSGTYSLFGNILAPRIGGGSAQDGELYEVDLTSNNQLVIKYVREGGGVGPQRVLVCNK